MGTYTKHVLKIYKKEDKELTEKLNSYIKELTDYDFSIREDNTIDDHTWNDGWGSKWYDCESTIEECSKRLGNVIIYLWQQCETEWEQEQLFQNGEEISLYTHNLGWEFEDENISDEELHENDYGELKDNPKKYEIVGDVDKRFK